MASETIKITIHPAETETELLTVVDAMEQVLDCFRLLAKAEPIDELPDRRASWHRGCLVTEECHGQLAICH